MGPFLAPAALAVVRQCPSMRSCECGRVSVTLLLMHRGRMVGTVPGTRRVPKVSVAPAAAGKDKRAGEHTCK